MSTKHCILTKRASLSKADLLQAQLLWHPRQSSYKEETRCNSGRGAYIRFSDAKLLQLICGNIDPVALCRILANIS